MGANCCVATKEKPLPYENRFEISNHRNIRNSPSWSFRWDNRTHIEDIINTPIRSEIKRGAKPETEGIQGRGAPLNKFRWQKSFTQTGTSDQFDVGVAGMSISKPFIRLLIMFGTFNFLCTCRELSS